MNEYTNAEKLNKIAENISEIMELLEITPTESNKETPMRISKMLVNELFKNINNKNLEDLDDHIKTFPAEGDTNNPIVVTVPFYSMCEHHWLPFFGTVTVSYIPNERIIGLSKIPRVVEYFSKKPQLQERLTEEIGVYLEHHLDPATLTVTVEAEHMCVSMRGAKTPCKTVTRWDKYYEA